MSKQGNFLVNQTSKLNTWFYLSSFFYWSQLALYRLSLQLVHIFFFQFFFFKTTLPFKVNVPDRFKAIKMLNITQQPDFTVLTHFYLTTYIFFIYLYRITFLPLNFIFYFVICSAIDTWVSPFSEIYLLLSYPLIPFFNHLFSWKISWWIYLFFFFYRFFF
jgi:hypothetical protein